MYMTRLLTSLLVMGCASAPVVAPVAPVASSPSEVARADEGCPIRARVVFWETAPDGTRTLLALECGYDGPQLEVGEHYPWGEGDSERIAIDQAHADAIWRVVRDSGWRDWESCDGEGTARWSVEIDDGTALMEATCSDLPSAWHTTYEALRRAEPRIDEDEWPFSGDYWRDELVYYRPVNE